MNSHLDNLLGVVRYNVGNTMDEAFWEVADFQSDNTSIRQYFTLAEVVAFAELLVQKVHLDIVNATYSTDSEVARQCQQQVFDQYLLGESAQRVYQFAQLIQMLDDLHSYKTTQPGIGEVWGPHAAELVALDKRIQELVQWSGLNLDQTPIEYNTPKRPELTPEQQERRNHARQAFINRIENPTVFDVLTDIQKQKGLK